MSDVKRVTLTTISDVVKKGGGSGATGGGSSGGPFGALAFDAGSAMSSPFGGGGGGGGPAGRSSSPFGGSSHSAAGKEVSGGGDGANRGKAGAGKKQKTVRLELNLFEPTAESFPEFNFSKLIHEEQKRQKKAHKKRHDESNNGFLSEPELDNAVARMARELERKYGSGTAYASKEKFARPTKLDYYDRGAGYDEEDSFIDNSEAYDELIPQEIETVGGGFYINSGQLEFKQLSNFERPDDVHRMPKPKKRALSTTSESSEDDEPRKGAAKKKADEARQPQPTPAAPEKVATGSEPSQPARQPLTDEERPNSAANHSGPDTTSGGGASPRVNGHVAKKQKMVDNGPTGVPRVAAVEKDKLKSNGGTNASTEADGGGGGDGKEKANGVKSKHLSTDLSTQVQPPMAAGGGEATGPASVIGSGKKDESETDGGMKLIKTTTVKDMLRAKRDSLRKMEQEKKGRSSGSSRVSSSEAEEDGDGAGDDDEDDDDEDDDEENDEDDDDDDDDEEDDDEREMGDDGSDKESNESGSDEDMRSAESVSSHGSASEKDAAARAKLSAVNGTDGDGQRPVTVIEEQQQQQQKKEGKEKEKERKRKESKLPEELPDALRKAIDTLKELAQGHAIGGKLNYFDSRVAEVLLQVDEGARSTSNSTRNAILRHLEAQLAISRQSLQLKIKKIRIRKLESCAKAAHDRLEDAICDQMPLLLAKHELDCRKVAEQRAAAQAATAAAAAASAASTAGAGGSIGVPASGGDGPSALTNGEKTGSQSSGAGTAQLRNPKKKFSWNERTRDLLWELYSVRVELYGLVRPRNETEDDFVADYMRNKLVPLWPKGWMRYEDLHKELDRRKKALAKSGAASAAPSATPPANKHPLATLPPLASALSSAVDPAWMLSPTGPGTVGHAVNGVKSDTGTPSPVPTQTAANLSTNGGLNATNKRTSSDHSISNIMNSPPLPPPPAAGEKHSGATSATASASSPANNRSLSASMRHSFDEDQLMLSPPKATGSSMDGSFGSKRGPSDSRTSLPAPDQQRFNSREDDSDSSIEIIGEYNVIGGGGHVPSVSVQSPALSSKAASPSGGVIHSAKSIIQSSSPPSTGPSTANPSSVLPVLNKEKYKNLIAGKNKAHGSTSGSGGANSPVGSVDNLVSAGAIGGGVLVGVGKYAKHSPSASGERAVVGSVGPPPPGGSMSFTNPGSAAASGPSTGGGGIRLSDVARMKDSSPAAPTLDLDVHQIMKDLKEFQELQQHHKAGSGRKSDTAAIPPPPPAQQQHDSIRDFLIGCDLDEDAFLFATNNYTYDGRRN